jgi:AbrB family looped-hinge helix DNA binding protein
MTTAVSEKGQVTIPKRVRDQLGIRAGTELSFAAVGGKLVASKTEETDDVFKKWRGRGHLPGGLSVAAYLAKSRDGHGR